MSNRILALLVILMVATSWARVVDFDFDEEKRGCKKCDEPCVTHGDCCYEGECKNGKCYHKDCFWSRIGKRMLEYMRMKNRNEQLHDRTNDHFNANDDDMPYEY